MNKVILLIPYYNNPEGLYKSLNSISDLESIDVLVVDDGSDFGFDTNLVETNFKANGSLFVEKLEVNSGIEHALNKGLEFILERSYTYVARLDCGDVCLPNRFGIQETFLKAHPAVALVGTNVEFVDHNGQILYSLKMPSKDHRIRKRMYLNAMHIHPTIMFRSEILNTIGLYPTNYKAAEDYAFFFKILAHYKLANINQVLVQCESNSKGISTIQRKMQAKNRIRIIWENFYFGLYPIYGLLRAFLLYLIPLRLLNFLKRTFK